MLPCTVDVRSLVCHLYQEKNDLVLRLNNICETIENTDPLIERVRLKIQWMYEKETSIKRIEKHIRCIKRLIEEPRLPEMGHLSWGYTETGKFNRELTAKLNKQLLALTLSAIEEGCVRESSFSERGNFTSHSIHERRAQPLCDYQIPSRVSQISVSLPTPSSHV
jgi:hypothetical protein